MHAETDLSRQHEDLAARYASIWRASRDAIADNSVAVDPLPEVGEPRWGVSAVFRPQLPQAVWETLAEISKSAGPDHAYYDQSNVHVTLRSNEGYRGDVPSKDPDVEGYAQVLSETLAGLSPPTVEFRGIIGARTSLLLCGYPNFDIIALRRGYFRRLERAGLLRKGPESSIEKVRNTCHATLAVFSGPLSDPKVTASKLDGVKDMSFGTVPIVGLEIVSYARTLDRVETRTLARVAWVGPKDERMSSR